MNRIQLKIFPSHRDQRDTKMESYCNISGLKLDKKIGLWSDIWGNDSLGGVLDCAGKFLDQLQCRPIHDSEEDVFVQKFELQDTLCFALEPLLQLLLSVEVFVKGVQTQRKCMCGGKGNISQTLSSKATYKGILQWLEIKPGSTGNEVGTLTFCTIHTHTHEHKYVCTAHLLLLL